MTRGTEKREITRLRAVESAAENFLAHQSELVVQRIRADDSRHYQVLTDVEAKADVKRHTSDLLEPGKRSKIHNNTAYVN